MSSDLHSRLDDTTIKNGQAMPPSVASTEKHEPRSRVRKPQPGSGFAGQPATYLRVLHEHRRLYLTLPLVGLLLGALAVVLIPPRYESTAVVELARVNGGYVITPIETRELLSSGLLLSDPLKDFNISDHLVTFIDNNLDIELVKEEVDYHKFSVTPYVRIRLRADTPQRSHDILSRLVEGFLSLEALEYNEQRSLLITSQERRSQLADEHEASRRQTIALLDAQLESARGLLQNTTDASAAQLQLAAQQYITDMDAQHDAIYELEQQNLEGKLSLEDQLTRTKPFRIITPPTLAPHQVFPRPGILLVGGFIGGLLIALLFTLRDD
ncbi:hypothetical protein AUJ68_02315 [Candidatus Woesearchaeota archaeon CG1_02_57_44]|nr:MAG: hypothetical protein AUJ68_02315 [Candidatus Woesearchaeota archaeon CG1_02_57_44]